MAFLECSRSFQLVHRTPDLPVYDEAFREFQHLASEGQIDGEGCRVIIGERQPRPRYVDVFVTIWRTVPIATVAGWKGDIDSGEERLRYRYTRSFNPATTTPTEVVAATREMLVTPRASN